VKIDEGMEFAVEQKVNGNERVAPLMLKVNVSYMF